MAFFINLIFNYCNCCGIFPSPNGRNASAAHAFYRYALGLCFIFLVSVIWASASVLVQFIYQYQNFDSPFLLTYIGTSLFTILIPIHWIQRKLSNCCCCCNDNKDSINRQHYQVIESPIPSDNDVDDSEGGNFENESNHVDNEGDSDRRDAPAVSEGDRIGGATSTPYSDNPRQRRHQHKIDGQSSISMTEMSTQSDDDHIQNSSQDDQEDDGHATTHAHAEHQHALHEPWTAKQHLRAAMKIALIWFISNYAYNASLLYTTITSSTVLASTGSLFTFIFAAGIFHVESSNYMKLLGVVFGMLGSIITGLHDASTSGDDNATIFNTTELSVLDDTGNDFGDGEGDHDDDEGGGSRRILQGLVLRSLESLSDEFASSSDTTDGDHEMKLKVWGDCLGLLSAVGYGLYAAMVRLLCPQDESLMSMELFLGFVGLCNAIALSPIAIYQVYISFNEYDGANDSSGNNATSAVLHEETISVIEYDNETSTATRLTWFVLGLLVIKGLMDNVLSDYLWARAVILTSATVATVGLGLTIPLAFLSDVILLGKTDVMDIQSIGGALAVLVGFVLVNLGETSSSSSSTTSSSTDEDDDDDDNVEVEVDNTIRSSRRNGEQELPVERHENQPQHEGHIE